MALFSSNIGGNASPGAELWVDLGLITSGFDFWIGSVNYVSSYKVVTFELRTNLATKSTGTTATTGVLDTWTSSSKVKSISRDLYKNGTLHIKTVVSSGVEHWWLRLKAKSSTVQVVSYSINYVPE